METKLKFKVGDKVRVRSLEWYNDNKNSEGHIRGLNDEVNFINAMALYCGQIFQIQEIENDYYLMHDNIFCWQDWMLENEAITEEKQEVEQLNKNTMETKEMTLLEAQEFLNNKKIMCLSVEETTKVQTKLFKLGIYWGGETEENSEIDTSTFLMFIENKEILQTNNIKDWIEDKAEKIEVSEILSIKIKEEKPRFDPKTLQPFDKVLVRDSDEVYWEARFFDRHEKEEGDEPYYTTNGYSYRYCVPYNEETKHLHNTTNEAPEFYGCDDF